MNEYVPPIIKRQQRNETIYLSCHDGVDDSSKQEHELNEYDQYEPNASRTALDRQGRSLARPISRLGLFPACNKHKPYPIIRSIIRPLICLSICVLP